MIVAFCLALLSVAEPGQSGPVGGFQNPAPAVQGPARDTSAAKGTASIKGRVVATETGKPMRRVQINLSSARPRRVSSNSKSFRPAATHSSRRDPGTSGSSTASAGPVSRGARFNSRTASVSPTQTSRCRGPAGSRVASPTSSASRWPTSASIRRSGSTSAASGGWSRSQGAAVPSTARTIPGSSGSPVSSPATTSCSPRLARPGRSTRTPTNASGFCRPSRAASPTRRTRSP
jgi:hypothetical protein